MSIVITAVLCSNCQFLWDIGNRGGLTRDVSELVFTGQENAPALDCRMVSTTRTGVCQGTLNEEGVAKAVQQLKLQAVTIAQKDDQFSLWAGEGECSSQSSADSRIFRSERRAPELRLKSGSAFEYLLLFFAPHDGTVCIQVSYAYG